MPRVSVIVPVFNGLAHLPAFFAALASALPGDAEVIVVDDASTEPISAVIPDVVGGADVVRLANGTNRGYAATVNRGIAVATGDVVVMLNSDLVVEPRCITAMLDLITEQDSVGIVGSKLVFPTTGLVQHVGKAFGSHTRPNVFFELPHDHPLCQRTREVQVTVGATAAASKRVVDLLGPFDEKYYNHAEDLDYCLRARQHGLRNFVCAESVAYHWVSQSGPARFAQLKSSDAVFWATWGGRYEVDLGRYVDEALDHVLEAAPHLLAVPFVILDLSRGPDESIVLERLAQRWSGIGQRVRRYRQTNNPADRLRLPLVLPHWVMLEPMPFIYLVDRHRELTENHMWFENRRRIVRNELVVDLNGVVVETDEIAPCRPSLSR